MWEPSPDVVARLRKTWDALPVAREPLPHEPERVAQLGYRGCELYRRDGGERWRAYGEVVARTASDGTSESRLDPTGQFERTLLDSAPRGLIPPGFLD